MRNSVSDEMLYLEAGGKEKTGGEEKEEDEFEFSHRILIFITNTNLSYQLLLIPHLPIESVLKPSNNHHKSLLECK